MREVLFRPVVLFRPSRETEQEELVVKKYFQREHLRTKVPKGSLVIGRYSVLPNYLELEKDLFTLGSSLINFYDEHAYIANFHYYQDLKAYTAETYTDYDFHTAPEGDYVVKGRTNSLKSRWNTHMLAQTKRQASMIAGDLSHDSLISSQGIIYRKFLNLKNFGLDPISGIPFSNEWRFFFHKKDLLSYGYYWSNSENPESHKISKEGIDFALEIANKIKSVDFYVLDIAELESGGWTLIEMNDGQMSGLSENNPEVLYLNLYKSLNGIQTLL